MAEQYDVLVIGAGVAGLAVARAVAEAGRSTLLLEARDRIGGRIYTMHQGTEVIELGAEFIHGRAPELWNLLDEAGLDTYERSGDSLHQEGTELVRGERDDDEVLEGLESYRGHDCSFAEYIASKPLSDAQKRRETSYVEGFNAADAREASVLALGRQQGAEDEIDGERNWRVTPGYERLPEFLRKSFMAAGGTLRMEEPVESVRWHASASDAGDAEVRCASGSAFRATKVVVTLPLGVLQARAVRFDPEPGTVLQAADAMRMGAALRVTLVFRRRLWPPRLSFLLTENLLPNVWWSAHPAESLTLTGWVGGPRSEALSELSGLALQAHVESALAAAFHISPATVAAELTGFYTHNWSSDPWSRGAYSWVPVSGVDASSQMSQPVGGTLFFAGEHTDTTGHWGTVHAALRSGLRAAQQVLSR